jgi:hypothetical protein
VIYSSDSSILDVLRSSPDLCLTVYYQRCLPTAILDHILELFKFRVRVGFFVHGLVLEFFVLGLGFEPLGIVPGI